MAAYLPAAHNPFVEYDDPIYITKNSHVQAGLTWSTLKWTLTSFEAGNWHPITWLVHAFNFQVFGLSAGGHHFISILLHAMNAVLLYLLLAHVTAAPGRSLIVAALFALHPLNVESVAWAAELKTVLCALFFLLALGAYGWYAQKPGANRYGLVAILFAFALASKPMAITLPFVLLLLDFWPLARIEGWSKPSADFPVVQRPLRTLIFEKAPLFLLCVGSAVVTLAAQRTTGSVVPLGVADPRSMATAVAPISFTLRLQNALISYGAYLWKAVWPFNLAAFYPYTFGVRPAWQLPLAVFLLLVVSLGAWKARHGAPYLAAAWLWYLGTLVPVIGLVQVGAQSMADRYMYVPLIGIFVMLVCGGADLARLKEWSPTATMAPATIVLAGLAALTWRQVGFWRSNYDLWSHALAVTANNPTAEHNISIDLMERGKLDEARGHLQRAVALDPGDTVSQINLAVALQNQGNYTESLQRYAVVLQQTSDPDLLPTVYENMGGIYHAVGDFRKAEESYLQALRINPNKAGARERLADLKTDEGINKFANAVANHPTADGYLRLGRMLSDANWIPQARYSYQKALEIDPSLREARNALAALPVEGSAR